MDDKILKLNEYNSSIYTTLSDEEVFEMANISDKVTGIKDVVIWIGPNPKYHGLRIKVSNVPKYFKPGNCFTITIPDLQVIGEVNTTLITNVVMNDIKRFIIKNVDAIKTYSDYELSTDEFISKLVKV